MIDKISEYIDCNRDAMIALWEEIVNMESGHTQKAEVDALCVRLQQEMKKANISTRIYNMDNAGNFLVGEWGKENPQKPILLVGHMDTVFQKGAVEKNPFRIENGKAYGPGVLDMKAGLVMAIFITKALIQAGYSARPIKLIFAGDEEILHMHSNANDILVEEARGSGAAFNFETGYLDDGLVVGRKGGMYFSIDVTGVSAHAGNAPEKGRNALQEMSYKIIEIQKINDFERGALVNAAIISAGNAENIIPGKCTVKGAFRFPTTAIKNEILEKLKVIADTTYVEGTTSELHFATAIECMETSEAVMKLFEHIKETAVEIGYGDVYHLKVGGASDSSIISTQGIPIVCGLGAKGEGNHTFNEYAVVDSIFERAKLVAAAIINLENEIV